MNKLTLSICAPGYPTIRLPTFCPSHSESFALISSERKAEEMMMANRNGTPIKRNIRRHQLREMVPLADSTIYEMEQRGEFPRRFALSPRCVVWDLAEVEAWLAARRASPVRRAQHPDVRQRRARPVRERDQARGAASKAG
jgi:prophage regulatory protein